MRIAILDVCVWLPEYQSGQAKFGEVIATWIKQDLSEAEISVIDIVEKQPIPAPEDYDGYVILGSDKGVYDCTDWMIGLRAFLLSARDANKPIFGICFGHQIMADVFGGKAEKVGDQQVGEREFTLDGETTTAYVWHQDQVTQVPPGAEVIASADYCPVGALSYEFPALSVQFHPEYPAEFLTTFISRSRGKILSEELSDDVIEQLSRSNVEIDLFAEQAADFFRKNISAQQELATK